MILRFEYGVAAPSSQRPGFFARGFQLPDESGSQAYDPNLDYQDVKLKIVQQEGYDAHDFNLFDDRSSQLWRKPYVDGAVRELTSGESRSQEQIRQAVEQMLIASGTTNPDVRHTSRKAHRSRANVTVDVDIDDEQDLLTDIRRDREDQVPSPPAHIKSSRAGANRTARRPPSPSGGHRRHPIGPADRRRGQVRVYEIPSMKPVLVQIAKSTSGGAAGRDSREGVFSGSAGGC